MRVDLTNFTIEIFKEHIKKSFQHKIENIFQEISFDILKTKREDLEITPFPTEGKDGSIDHYGVSENKRVIIECKKNNTYDNSIAGVTGLSTKLLKSLDEEKAEENLYKPWFNPTLSEYIFLTSATLKTAKEVEEIRERLSKLMKDLSEIGGLQHLENIKITLLSWNDLKPILEDSPFLMNRWIEDPIRGVKSIEDLETSRYKKNLYGEKLPFISIEEFNKNFPDKKIESEKEIYKRVFIENEEEGIFLHGEGGVGKTRFMFEFGFMAERDGWIVYRVTKDLDSLKDLDLKPNNKYCLLFDYIEENRHFQTPIIETLKDTFPHTDIKVIGNSRSSYLQTTTPPNDMLVFNLSKQKSYPKFVTSKILEGVTTEEDYLNVNPSFAVFIKEEYEKDRVLQKDFKKYLTKRLLTTLGLKDFTEVETETISILSSLSFSDSDRDLKKDLKPLIKAGWIENSDIHFSSEHDTIIDKLFEIYITQEKFDLEEKKEEIEEILESSKNIFSTFRTFDRISEILKKENITNYQFFYEKIVEHLDFNQDFIDLIAKTSLLNEKYRFELYLKKKEYFKSYIEEFNFLYPLCFALVKDSEKTSEDLTTLIEIWGKTNSTELIKHKHSYRIIAASLKKLGLDYTLSKEALNWLGKFHLKEESSFIIKSWLDAGGDLKSVERYALNWLEAFPLKEESSFIIKSWLDAGGDLKSVERYALNWLEAFPLKEESSFIIKSWLDAGGDLKSVERYALNWLEAFPLKEESSFIIKSWLVAGGDLGSVEIYALNWLEAFPLKEESHFVIKSWLDAGGDLGSIKTYALNWLEAFPLKEESHFVIKSWLDAGGDLGSIKTYALNWLGKFHLKEESDFVIKSWLDAGGDLGSIKTYALNWLGKFHLKEESDFVIKSWLDAGGDLGSVERYALNWLDKFSDKENASFIINALLKKKTNFNKETLEIFYKFIRFNKDLDDLDFVLKRVFKIPPRFIGKVPKDIIDIAFKWCAKNLYNREIIFMVSYMFKFTRSHPLFYSLSKEVICRYIHTQFKYNEIMPFESIIFSNFKNRNFSEDDSKYLQKWLKKSESFDSKNSSNLFYIQKDKSYYEKLIQLAEGNSQLIKKLDKFFNTLSS